MSILDSTDIDAPISFIRQMSTVSTLARRSIVRRNSKLHSPRNGTLSGSNPTSMTNGTTKSTQPDTKTDESDTSRKLIQKEKVETGRVCRSLWRLIDRASLGEVHRLLEICKVRQLSAVVPLHVPLHCLQLGADGSKHLAVEMVSGDSVTSLLGFSARARFQGR